MVHVLGEFAGRDLSRVLGPKPLQQPPIGVLKTPSYGFDIANVSVAFCGKTFAFGEALYCEVMERELTFDRLLLFEEA